MTRESFSVKTLRESLEAQLRDQGSDVAHFRELIDSYLYFYSMEKKMRADVKKNGLLIDVETASGGVVQKENPCIKNAAAYNRQRLGILKEMGLTTSSVRIVTDDDSDL